LRLFISGPPSVLRLLAKALGRDERLDVIGSAAEAAEMIETLARSRADVLVLGAEVLDGELVGLARKVAALHPGMRILIVSRAESDERVIDCLQAGAAGFLSLDPPLSELAAAVEAVARGERVCPPRVMRLLFARLGQLGRERKRRDRLEVLDLTAREMEILRLIADGLTNQEIARRLFLSAYTVKNHIHRIFAVLGVQSRWGAVDHALAKGWLPARRPSPGDPSGDSRADPDSSD
jgi:DNA-binding NarL/FixJ family response regulator